MTAASLPLARSGYDVVLDFSIPPDFLPIALKILKDTPLEFVVLLPSLSTCERRAANRSEGIISDYQRYRSFYAMFLAASERFTICDDAADASTMASRYWKAFAPGGFELCNPQERPKNPVHESPSSH
jgi:hypothetical protein